MKYYHRILRDLPHQEHSFKTLFTLAFSNPDAINFEESDNLVIRKTTYGQCKEEVLRLAGVLQGQNLPGASIALVMDNSPLWVACFWALLMSGHRALLLSAQMGQADLDMVLQQADAKLILGDRHSTVCPSLSIETLATAQPEQSFRETPDQHWGEEICLATSGTTGQAKLCVHTGQTIYKNILNSQHLLRHSKDLSRFYRGHFRHLAILPFSHIFGLTACFLWFTIFNITYVFLKDLRPETILRTVRLHQVTHIFAVPALWDTLAMRVMKEIDQRGLSKKAQKGLDLSLKLQNISPALGKAFARLALKAIRRETLGDAISFCISGGGMLKKDTLRVINALGYPLTNGYGMTEIGIAAVCLGNRPKQRLSGSVGNVFPSLESRFTSEDELQVWGDSIMAGHLQNGKFKPLEEGAWLSTGDCFLKDFKGALSFTGRMDDLVNGANGERISPDAIESQLQLEVQVCALGLANGELALAFHAPAPTNSGGVSQRETVEQVLRAVGKLPLHLMPKHILVMRDPLPLSGALKVRRHALRQGIQDGSLVYQKAEELLLADSFGNSSQELRQTTSEMQTLFAHVLGLEDLPQAHSNFFVDLGGDSLLYLELIFQIEQRWQLNLMAVAGISLVTPVLAAEHVLRQNKGYRKG